MRFPKFNHFPPAIIPFIVAFLLLFSGLFVLIQIGILEYAYEKIGISPRYIFGLLFFSLVGSWVNIPVARLPSDKVDSNWVITFFGVRLDASE